MSSENQQMVNVRSNISSDNQSMSDINSDVSSEHQQKLIRTTSASRQEMASEQSKQLNDLQKHLELDLTYIKEKQHTFFQEYREQVEQLLCAQHSYNTDLLGIIQSQKELQTQFASLVTTQYEISSGIASLTEKVDQLKDYQSNLKEVSQKIQRSDEHQEPWLAIQNRISCDLREFSEKQSQLSQRVDSVKKSQTVFSEQQQQQPRSHLSQQEEMLKLFQNILLGHLLKLRNNMKGEMKAVSDLLLREQDKLRNDITGELKAVSEKLCVQDERFRNVQKMVTEQQQQQLATFQDFSCEIQELYLKQQLQFSQQDEKLQFFHNILAEQQQKIPMKFQELFKNQQSQQERKLKVVQNLSIERQHEQQANIQKFFSSLLKDSSEKQKSQMSGPIQTIAEQKQSQALNREWVGNQRETDIQLKELCYQIQKSMSAIQKKLEGVEASVTGGPDFLNKHSTTKQNENSSSANVGQGKLFMGDVVVEGNVIGKIDMRDVFEEKKTLQEIQIQKIDNQKISILKKKYENQTARVMCQETMTENPEPKDTRTLGTMTEVQSLERRTGDVVQHQQVEEKLVVLGEFDSKGDAEVSNGDCNTLAVDAKISDGPEVASAEFKPFSVFSIPVSSRRQFRKAIRRLPKKKK